MGQLNIPQLRNGAIVLRSVPDDGGIGHAVLGGRHGVEGVAGQFWPPLHVDADFRHLLVIRLDQVEVMVFHEIQLLVEFLVPRQKVALRAH